MFSVFRCSKLLIKSNQLFLIPISDSITHYYFSSLIHSNNNNHTSYTVSYLINTFGLSPERANYASKKLNFKTPERPDSVIELLNKYGFNQTHISVLMRRSPDLFSYDPEKTLLPKLEFFKSIGVSDIGSVLSSDPKLLSVSLENRMIPAYKLLKSVIGSDEKMVTICERSSWVVYSRNVIPNITVLREFKVPSSSIELLINHYQLSIIQNHEIFRVVVHKVKEMGFDPLKSTFVQAVRVLSGKGNKLIWDRCSGEYKKWGWSEDDVLSAFKKHPSCMIVSARKIEKTMSYLVNNIGCKPKTVVSFPSIVNFNLEKRIIPRCSVIQVLSSKGLIKNISLRTILLPAEKLFLERFVTRYEDQLPQLMTVYQGDAGVLAM